MNAAIYARKSTVQERVAGEEKSVEGQAEEGEDFAIGKGWSVNKAHIYMDDGISGALFTTRPDYQRMLRDAEANAFQHLVVFDLDRFSRGDPIDAVIEVRQFLRWGVQVWTYCDGQPVTVEGLQGLMAYMKFYGSEEYRKASRKHTRRVMRRHVENGRVMGCKVYGYINVRVGGEKGPVHREILEEQAKVVRQIHSWYADGHSFKWIAQELNRTRIPAPRSKDGVVKKWAKTTIRAILENQIYRGEVIYGRKQQAIGRAELSADLNPRLRLNRQGKPIDHGLISKAEETWLKISQRDLCIFDDKTLLSRVDARLRERSEKWAASVAAGSRRPERAAGAYLLSGGLLRCPECKANFSVRSYPRSKKVYMCTTVRHYPGGCSSKLELEVHYADDVILSEIEGRVLGPEGVAFLLSTVREAPMDDSARLEAERLRLQEEIDRLVKSVAKGMPAESVAPLVRENQVEIARLDKQLRAQRPTMPPPDQGNLRAALEQRIPEWKAVLRGETRVARLLLRQLITPLTLEVTPPPAWLKEMGGLPTPGGKPAQVGWTSESRPKAMLDGIGVQLDETRAGIVATAARV